MGDNGRFTCHLELLKNNLQWSRVSIGNRWVFILANQHKRVIAQDDECLFDIDICQLLPNLIIDGKYYPQHLTPGFLNIYQSIVKRRLEAKAKR